MNKVFKTIWNESIGAWIAVNDDVATRGKSSRSLQGLSLSVLTLAGALAAGLLAFPSTSYATTYGPNQSTCESSGSGPGPDGVNRAATNAARDGTGVWSNIIGCGANGGGFSGVQVLGPYANAAGAGAVALGFASSAGLRGTGVGMQAVASGTGATALGQWTRATGTGSVAIGGNTSSNTAAAGAQATSNDAIAIAGQSRASGSESIAIGVRSSAVSAGDIAIGSDSLANGTTNNMASLAIGRGSRAVGEDATALGNSSRAEADYGTSIGNFAAVTARNATAIGNSSTASGGAATSIGNFSTASGLNAVAIGAGGVPGAYVGTQASGGGAMALGGNQVRGASSAAQDGVALGGEAIVDADAASGMAMGRGARVFDTAAYGIALGDGAGVRDQNDIAIGRNAATSAQSGGNNIAMGNGVTTGANGQNVAIGSGSTSAVAKDASGGAVAIGRDQKATGNGAVALGDPNTANGDGAVALGQDNVAAGDAAGNSAAQGAVAIGSGNQAIGQGSVALGNASQAAAAGALAFGDSAQASALNGVALGSNAVASNAGDVALGTGSSTAAAVATSQAIINGTTYSFAGTAPSSTVSVGAAGAERTITNLAAGRVRAACTDAINGSQLYATNQAVDQVGDTITNIAGDTSQANTDANGVGIRYVRTNEAGLAQSDASAQGQGSTAVGYNATATAESALALGREATASHAGSVALGANAVADGATLGAAAYNPGTAVIAGTAPVGEVSVGGANAERRLTNVAAGATDTDAVNVSQLKSVAASVSDLDAGAVKYDRNPDGTVNYESVTLNPGGSPTTIDNVAAGELSATSTEAVNGSQLNATNQAVTQIGDSITNIAGDTSQANTDANGIGIRYVRTNEAGLTQSDASAQGQGSTAVGYNATATAESALALGRETSSSIVGGVALGASSVSDRALTPASGSIAVGGGGALVPFNTTDRNLLGAVSVGDATAYRQITNLADGTDDHDAVTVRQLTGAMTSLTITGTRYFHANSTADDSLAAGAESVAIGPNTVVNGDDGVGMGNGAIVEQNAPGGIAVGERSHAQLADAIALGTQASASGEQSMALGAGSSASTVGGVALGAGAVAATAAGVAGYVPAAQGSAAVDATRSTLAAVSVGDAATGKFRQITGVAAGAADSDAVNVSQLKSLASNVNDLDAGAVKYDRNPDGTINYGSVTLNPSAPGGSQIHNVAAGTAGTDAVNVDQLNQSIDVTRTRYYSINDNGTRQANFDNDGASGVGAMAAGVAAVASGERSLSVGNGNIASGARTAAMGSGNTVSGSGSYAYGNDNTIASADAFVIGSGVTIGAGLDGAVVLGRGSMAVASSPTARGTINGVEYLYAGGNPAAGDVVSVGSADAPRQIQHVAAGQVSATSLDAINGSQLYATNQAINSLGQVVDNINTGGGIKYFHANGGAAGVLPDSQANGLGSVAVGPAAVASGAGAVAMGNEAAARADGAIAIGAGAQARQQGDVALGDGAIADRGAESYTGKYSDAQNSTAGTVSVGAAGAERSISNVADGRNATDAVNLRQLDGAVQAANDYTDQRIGDVNESVVQIGDTVNALDGRVTQVEGDVNKLKNGSEGMFQVNQDAANVAPRAEGRNSVAGGAGAVASGSNGTAVGNGASASGSNSTAMGSGSNASGDSATAMGNGSKAEASNSVALGAGSVAQRSDTVSVGAVGAERQIVNVAPGTAGTDAVNVNQLRDVQGNLGNQIASVKGDLRRQDNRLSAGVASAMAMASLPQAYLPGRSMFSMGGGSWRGESGFAMGLSTVSDNGRWVVKGLASSSSRGDYGGAVGVGYQW